MNEVSPCIKDPSLIIDSISHSAAFVGSISSLVLVVAGSIILFALGWVAYTAILKLYVDYKLRNTTFDYIVVYPEGQPGWLKVMEEEIDSIIPSPKLVLKFEPNSDDKKFNDLVTVAYSLNRTSVYIVDKNKRFDLWKAVRKAAYGHPTKLNNLKQKILNEINR